MPLPLRFETTETPNLFQIRIGQLTVFYSYQTPIGFLEGKEMKVRDVSELSVQTKKHTTKIEPEFGIRMFDTDFLPALEAALKKAMAEAAKP